MRTLTRRGAVAAQAAERALLDERQHLGLRRRGRGRRSRRGTASRRRRSRPAPACARARPENAPRSCPNSSLSTRLSGIAEQLSSTNGPVGHAPTGRGACAPAAACRCRSRRRSARRGRRCARSSAASATSLVIASDAKIISRVSARPPSRAGRDIRPGARACSRAARCGPRPGSPRSSNGFLMKSYAPSFIGADRVGDRALRRDDEELRVGGVAAHLAQQIEPAAIAEHEVEDHRVGTHRLELAQPLRARAGQRDVVALTRQRAAQRLPDQRFVVDDQDLGIHRVTSPAAA